MRTDACFSKALIFIEADLLEGSTESITQDHAEVRAGSVSSNLPSAFTAYFLLSTSRISGSILKLFDSKWTHSFTQLEMLVDHA